MKLRAHHLLCFFGFRGLGYNEEFVQNFKNVLQQLKANPQLKVEIVDKTDSICAHCPHQKDNICQKNGRQSQKMIRDKDNLIIKRLGIKKGQTFCSREIFNLVSQNIFPEDLRKICIGCEWLRYGYCLTGLRQDRLKKCWSNYLS
jgi:hypothetical protein